MGLSIIRLQLLFILLAMQHATATSNTRKLRNKHRSRRRNQQNGDKFDPDKDRPCLADDGTIVVPDDILDGDGIGSGGGEDGLGIGIGGGGGGRFLKLQVRNLQQRGGGQDPEDKDSPWDSPWDLCEDDAGDEVGDDDDNSGFNSTSTNSTYVPTLAPVAAPNTEQRPTLISAPTSVAPTLSPTPLPTTFPQPVSLPPTIGVVELTLAPTMFPTRKPKFPGQFFNPEIRKTLFCQVSVALPAFYRRNLLDEEFDETEERRLHGENSSSKEENELMQLGAARRFKHKVGDVMSEIVMNSTNFTIVVGPKDLRRLQSGGSGGSNSNGGGGSNNNGGAVSNGGGGGNGNRSGGGSSNGGGGGGDIIITGDPLLLISAKESNVVPIEDQNLHLYQHGVRWWLYTIAMHSIDDGEDFSVIENTVMNLTDEAIASGEFYERLKIRFNKVVAVSQPGDEFQAILPAAEEPSPVDGIDVRYWDASRWIGLGLFAMTVLSTLALTRTAQHRRKKVQEQEDWGVGLATEKGMNQLLTYGWEYDGATNQVHAFDKSKLVYRDDDSLLIGGAYPLGITRSDLEAPAPTEAVTSSHNASSNTQGTPTDRSPSSRGPSSGTDGS